MKRRVLQVLTADVLAPLRRPLTRGVATVLMMHRFHDRAYEEPAHDLRGLRRHLSLLRRHKYNLISLPELIRHFEHGVPLPPRTTVFTVDDGYADFAQAAPIFAEFECPVTVFLITQFVGGRIWCWWDKVEFAFLTTDRTGWAAELSTGTLRLSWNGARSRRTAARRVCERLKRIPDAEREAVLAKIERHLDVDVPPLPPDAYAPLSWDAVGALERAHEGISFGPHTCTHPIMSRVDDERARAEITQSWRILQERVERPVPVFCYPNGDRHSFSERDHRILADVPELVAAVTAVQGYVGPDVFTRDELSRYAIPRFPYYDSRLDFIQVTTGIERLKRRFRYGEA